MSANKYQMEWDHASYVRKFHQTIAYIQIGEGTPHWRWVGTITDSGLVHDNPRTAPLGQIVTECQGGKILHDPEKYPVVQFFYKGIMPGVYASKDRFGMAYYLVKRHLKSYKIGLSDETFNIMQCATPGMYDRVTRDIDLDNRIMSYVDGGMYEVFSPKVVRIGSNLFADGDNIGFMEGGTCVLRDKAFVPFIEPLLENKWQIAN